VAFVVDPERASLELGLPLSPTELDTLKRIPAGAIEQLAKCLDDRIRRLPSGSRATAKEEHHAAGD